MLKNELMIKRAFTRAFAVFIAVIVGHYYAMAEKCWIPIAVILVMQTAIGLAVRQGVQRFIVIVLSAALGTYLVMFIKQPVVLDVLMSIVFCISCYCAVKYSLSYFSVSIPFLIATVTLIAMLLPATEPNVLYARIYDIALGAAIGILTNLLVFPSRIDVEFRENVIPILDIYISYLTEIMNLLFKKDEAALKKIDEKQILMQKILQTQSTFFPAWIYESGLSIALRSGHRHFLVMVERVGQILFSMRYIARQQINEVLLSEIHEPVVACIDQAKDVMRALMIVLNLQRISEGVSDLSEEIAALDKAYRTAVPLSLELIDVSQDYIYVASLVQDIKDLRTALLRLAVALRQ